MVDPRWEMDGDKFDDAAYLWRMGLVAFGVDFVKK